MTLRAPDATTVLIAFVCLLLFLPSALVVESLGSAGAPSNLLGLGALFLWGWFHVHRDQPLSSDFQPVRAALLVWFLAMLVAYAHAMARPIPYDEISVADSGMLRLASFSGVLLLANDGIVSRDRLGVLLRLLVLGTGALAVFGLLQYATGELFVDRLSVPGLVNGAQDWSIGSRGGFFRPSGTSTSPIEYGVVLTMTLPLAITFAVSAPTRRWLYRSCVAAIAFAVFLSGSRSALVCAVVGLVALACFWSTGRRLVALGWVAVVGAVVYLTVPGSMGSLAKMFTGASEDPSIASRTGSYEIAGHFITNSPWLGRGFGTFLPRYQILDNAYLGLLIEGGVVGLVGLVVLIWAGCAAALGVHRRAPETFDRQVGQALLASIVAGACSLAFFDTFAFPQAAGPFFLAMGMAGALRRLTQTPADRVRPTDEPPRDDAARPDESEEPVGPEVEATEERVAVVVVLYNCRDLLPDLVDSLSPGCAGVPYELVAVDNCSPDDSAEVIRRLAPDVTLVRMERNAGYAAGINAGVAAAGTHTAVLAINPDVRLGAGCVPALLAAVRAPGVGIAVPRLADARGELIESLHREPTVLRALGDVVLGTRRAGRFGPLGEVVTTPKAYESSHRVDWAEGSTQLISAACWQECGPWDESFFLYSEETEFDLRARRRGHATVFVPTARAVHLEGGSGSSPALWSLLVTNQVRLFRRSHGPVATGAFWLLALLREVKRSLLGRPTSRAAVRTLLTPARWRRLPGAGPFQAPADPLADRSDKT